MQTNVGKRNSYGNVIIVIASLQLDLVALSMRNHVRKLPQLAFAIDVAVTAITRPTVMHQHTRKDIPWTKNGF